MDINVFYGILIPFLGTSAGAACVFFMKKNLNEQIQRALTGFAAGVMVAASIWSLLIPAIEQSSELGKFSFVPAAVGFWIGVLFLLLLDHMIPHLHQNSNKAEGPKSKLQRTTMLVLAVTLHNIPEGMAVGVVYAGYLTGHAQITIMGAMALSIGIAIQNFPEGAIISMPLRSEGMGKTKAFAGGVLSGIVEPVGAVLTILAAGLIVGLGTDGTSSNNNLDMLEEARLTAMLHKNNQSDPLVIPAKQALNLATKQGALALGLTDVGEVKVGQKADLVLYDMNKPYWYPRHDRTSLFVYAANASDADTVIVNGKILMEHGNLLTIDEEKVYAEANKCGLRLTK